MANKINWGSCINCYNYISDSLDNKTINMRILFVILTCEKYEDTRQKWQKESWINNMVDFIYLDGGYCNEDNYSNLSKKYETFFLRLGDNDIKNYDWIFFCDDDTFVFVDRLEKLLLLFDPSKPVLIGSELTPELVAKATDLDVRACSGGAGIAISSELAMLIKSHVESGECIVLNEQADVTLGIWASNCECELINLSHFFKPHSPKIVNEVTDEITFHYCDEECFKLLNNKL